MPKRSGGHCLTSLQGHHGLGLSLRRCPLRVVAPFISPSAPAAPAPPSWGETGLYRTGRWEGERRQPERVIRTFSPQGGLVGVAGTLRLSLFELTPSPHGRRSLGVSFRTFSEEAMRLRFPISSVPHFIRLAVMFFPSTSFALVLSLSPQIRLLA